MCFLDQKATKHKPSCELIGCVQAACLIKYEELKDKCTQPGFNFAIQYPQALLELQSLYDYRLISDK